MLNRRRIYADPVQQSLQTHQEKFDALREQITRFDNEAGISKDRLDEIADLEDRGTALNVAFRLAPLTVRASEIIEAQQELENSVQHSLYELNERGRTGDPSITPESLIPLRTLGRDISLIFSDNDSIITDISGTVSQIMMQATSDYIRCKISVHQYENSGSDDLIPDEEDNSYLTSRRVIEQYDSILKEDANLNAWFNTWIVHNNNGYEVSDPINEGLALRQIDFNQFARSLEKLENSLEALDINEADERVAAINKKIDVINKITYYTGEYFDCFAELIKYVVESCPIITETYQIACDYQEVIQNTQAALAKAEGEFPGVGKHLDVVKNLNVSLKECENSKTAIFEVTRVTINIMQCLVENYKDNSEFREAIEWRINENSSVAMWCKPWLEPDANATPDSQIRASINAVFQQPILGQA